jgi:hypothetical protein
VAGSGGESKFSDLLGKAKHYYTKPLCFLLTNTCKIDLLMDIFSIPEDKVISNKINHILYICLIMKSLCKITNFFLIFYEFINRGKLGKFHLIIH